MNKADCKVCQCEKKREITADEHLCTIVRQGITVLLNLLHRKSTRRLHFQDERSLLTSLNAILGIEAENLSMAAHLECHWAYSIHAGGNFLQR